MTTQHIISGDNADIVAAAVHAARRKRGQNLAGFPRFLCLYGEEGKTRHATVKALAAELSCIRQGTPVWVFRNAGHGATITLDEPSHT